MSETDAGKRKRSGLLWLLLLLAVVLAWWYFRPAADPSASDDQMEADRVAAYGDPDDILVDLNDDASAADVAAIERDLGIDLVLLSDQAADDQLYRAHVDADRRDAILEALSRHPEVEIAEPDAQVQAWPGEPSLAREVEPLHPEFPNDPMYQFQWHMDQIGMREAWPLADAEGVIVAVIDTGVAHENYQRFTTMPDLEGVPMVKPYNFVKNTEHANDDHGHGTHVAGTIAQTTHNGVGVTGIGRKVSIMPLKVLGGDGSGSVGAIADAIDYAADNGASVINMSLGGPFPSRIMKKAVARAHDRGVVVVCAAGNDGKGKVSYPAAYPGSFAVAATQYDESTTFYSNWGKEIDIAAPGGNTRVDQNGDGMPDGVLQNTIAIGDPSTNDYFAYMGTSMASPHVAGVAALVFGEGVTNPDQVEEILQSTAREPRDGGMETKRYGAGIVDAGAAVKKARTSMGGWQALLGLLLAGAIAASSRRRGLGAGFYAAAAVGAGGLFFVNYLGGVASWPGVEMLTRGIPSWDLALLGPAGHGNALFFSALIPLGLVALLASTRWRTVVAGLCAGIAAHLLFHAVVSVTAIHYAPFDALWLAANAAVSGWLAYLVLRK